MKRVEVDKVQTINKAKEMIAINCKNMDDKMRKTKNNSLQILVSRKQLFKSCDDNTDCVKPNTNSLNVGESDHNKMKSVNEQRKKKRNYFTDSQKIFDGFQIGALKIKSNEISEQNCLEKRRFEEIEDKLEQMFAGIEDEQLVNTTADEKNIPEQSNNSLKKYLNSYCNGGDFNNANKKPKTSLSRARNKQFRDRKNLSIPKSKIYLKKIPKRKGLSIGISKELLKISMKANSDRNEKKNNSNNIEEEGEMTSVSLNLQTYREDNQTKKKTRNKIQTNSSKYQKEINYIHKFEFPNINTKHSRQKAKHPRLNSLLSSENDTDEKQPRDIEIKTRSPFVLLKNNGTIVVVNTMTPDDSNEKLTKQKKNSNYVYERKIIKGCHSSTLSNRYDADTADSSWKCVFCKIGPHKKNLGDLFGPYIISSNCDDYRTMKDYLEKFQKYRNIDTQFLNFPKKPVKLVNEKSISHIRNIFGCDYEQINIYELGMSQVSVDCYEIWIHEECAIWAPNILVVGSRLAGLEEATWNSMRYECTYCLKQGALLCCLQRDCKTTCHVPCAIESKWFLDESKFWVYCRKHAFNKL